jgi:hypothetical protein
VYLCSNLIHLVMKYIRIGSAVRHLEDADRNITLFRIQEILTEYRSTLINGILSDLHTYLQFKLYIKVEKETHSMLRDKLLDLSNSKINLDRYEEVVREITASSSYRVSPTAFFHEIDTLLDSVLNPVQLTLVR